ncbi:MAG: aldo/keto reductase, partial [Bacteroidota bacterium]
QQLAEMVGSQSPATLALRYAMSKPAVSTIAVGASSLAQVEENVKAGSLGALTEDELATLEPLTPAYFYENHR